MLSGQTGKLKENLLAGEQALRHLIGIQPSFVAMQMKILGAANHLKKMLAVVITEASEQPQEEKNQGVLDILTKFFKRETDFVNAVKDLKKQLDGKFMMI